MNLIIETVNENGPAWKCGIRPGDVIVTVDDWLITVMDKPQVHFVEIHESINVLQIFRLHVIYFKQGATWSNWAL